MENKNQPVHPTTNWDQLSTGEIVHVTDYIGLTKREWFAGMALQGWLASSITNDIPDKAMAARKSVEYADALLSELSKP
jgi:hypothetical protein